MSSASRSLAARIGGLVTSSRHDGATITAPARRAFLRRFLLEVDPEGLLSEDERQRRAAALLRAHMARLAHASAVKRARAASRSRHRVAPEHSGLEPSGDQRFGERS